MEQIKVNDTRSVIILFWIALWSVNFANLEFLIYFSGIIIGIIILGSFSKYSRNTIVSLFCIIYFSVIYSTLCFLNHEKGIGYIITYAFTPAIAFFMGYYFTRKQHGKIDTIYWLIRFIIIFMFIYTTLNMSYVIIHGWSYARRSTVNIWTGGFINPTNQGGYLALNCILFPLVVLCREKYKKSQIILIYALLISSVAYTLILANRTYLILLGANVIVGYFEYLSGVEHKGKFIIKTLFYLFFAVILLTLLYNFDVFKIQTFWKSSTFYTRLSYVGTQYDRTIINNDRFPTWRKTILTIPSHFFGGKPDGVIISYAHNLWLDVQWVGGVLPLIACIFMTVQFLITVYVTVKKHKTHKHFKLTTICFAVTIFLEFMVEPIIEGYYYLFMTFFIIWGALCAINQENAITRMVQTKK